ncbi:unnamed protein product, partial [Mesorhabditis spiculigera]
MAFLDEDSQEPLIGLNEAKTRAAYLAVFHELESRRFDVSKVIDVLKEAGMGPQDEATRDDEIRRLLEKDSDDYMDDYDQAARRLVPERDHMKQEGYESNLGKPSCTALFLYSLAAPMVVVLEDNKVVIKREEIEPIVKRLFDKITEERDTATEAAQVCAFVRQFGFKAATKELRDTMFTPHDTELAEYLSDDDDAAGDSHACLGIGVSIEDPAALHRFVCFLTKPKSTYPVEVISGFQTTLALDGSRCLQMLDKFTAILPSHPVTLRQRWLCLWPAGASYSPADYLDIYMHALPKLRTVPRLRLNQMYHEKSDCLGSLTVIEQLIREIVKNTQSSAPRQVIAFRTLRYVDDVSQEDRAEYQREMDVMLNRLIDTFNISPPSYPLQMYVVDSVGSARSRLPGRGTTVWATGIRIMLALNDAEEHAQRLIEQEPWPAPNVYGTTLHTNEPADRLRLRWNSSTISPFNTV